MNHTLHVGVGSTLGAVTLFPVWTDEPGINGVEWSAQTVLVTERAGSPVVAELVVQNESQKPVVLLEGDLLSGGWQDRMLASGTILRPRESKVVDVVCVEHGRWGGDAQHVTGRARGAASVRFGLLPDRNESAFRSPQAQHRVWQRIGRFETQLQSTRSSSMLTHLSREANPELLSATKRLPGQRGVVVGIGGEIAWCELFGSTAGLASRWGGIIAAATLDAQLAPAMRTPSSAARSFIRRVGALSAGDPEQVVALEDGGETELGQTIRSNKGSVVLTALYGMKRSIHATAFNVEHPLMQMT